MKLNGRHVQLVSGGLDSLVLDHYLTRNEVTHDKLWINYGQTEANEERAATKRLWPDAICLDVQGAEAIKHGRYFPNRNLWLAATASLYFDAEVIWLAGLADDRCVDKSEEAFSRMSEVLSLYAGHEVWVKSPFWHTDKSTAVCQYLQTGGSAERLLSTWSCYSPKSGQPCLNCEACFRWSIALRSNGLDVAMPDNDLIKSYLQKIHEYDSKRIWSTIKAIQTNTRKAWFVDIDGILTNETKGWDFANRTPNLKNIARVRLLYEQGNWIVLWSSRRSIDRNVTNNWLNKFNVPRHALLLDKPPFAISVDDLNMNWTGDPADGFVPGLA